MINIYNQLNKNGFLLLNGEPIDIESVVKIKKYFNGYNKTISTVMMAYFGLPTWPALILFDPTLPKVSKSIEEFSKLSNKFFIRSDTFENKIDNLNFRDATSADIMEDVKKIKEYNNRWVIILAVPNDPGQEFRNKANCRMGLINGELTQEWTGEGFAEYHLGKDKFPHKAALHAVVKFVTKDKYQRIYQIGHKEYLADLRNLLVAYGLEGLRLKRRLLDKDYYKELTGQFFSQAEPANEELEKAFDCWLKKEKISLNKLIEQGIKYISSFKKRPRVVAVYRSKGRAWYPNKSKILTLYSYYQGFKKKCRSLGIDPEGKILTCSFNDSNKSCNRQGVVFWDIFNLL